MSLGTNVRNLLFPFRVASVACSRSVPRRGTQNAPNSEGLPVFQDFRSAFAPLKSRNTDRWSHHHFQLWMGQAQNSCSNLLVQAALVSFHFCYNGKEALATN